MFASQVLIIFVGYLWPLFRSMEAIQSRRMNDLRDCLLYWSILALSLFVEFFLQTLFLQNKGISNNWWMIRIVYLLWLNHSSTHGADFLYQTMFRDLFSHHEKTLDSFMRATVEGTQETVMRQLQLLTWQLLLSPSDGAISYAFKIVRPFIFTAQSTLRSNLISFGILSDPAVIPPPSTELKSRSNPSREVVRRQPSGCSLSQALLRQFIQLLQEEISVESGTSLRSLRPCQVTIVRQESTLHVFTLQSSKMTSDQDSFFSLHIPLVNVTDVCLHPSNPRVIVIKYLPIMKSSGSVVPKSVLIQAEDEPESEALLAGLQVLATSIRATAVGVLTTLADICDSAVLRKQFATWKHFSSVKLKETSM